MREKLAVTRYHSICLTRAMRIVPHFAAGDSQLVNSAFRNEQASICAVGCVSLRNDVLALSGRMNRRVWIAQPIDRRTLVHKISRVRNPWKSPNLSDPVFIKVRARVVRLDRELPLQEFHFDIVDVVSVKVIDFDLNGVFTVSIEAGCSVF